MAEVIMVAAIAAEVSMEVTNSVTTSDSRMAVHASGSVTADGTGTGAGGLMALVRAGDGLRKATSPAQEKWVRFVNQRL
jgi:hypothetical protein